MFYMQLHFWAISHHQVAESVQDYYFYDND